MPAIICAGCAVKLKLPDTFTATAVRCPKCKHVNQVEPPAAPPPESLAPEAPRPSPADEPSDQLEETPTRKTRRDEAEDRDEAPKKAAPKEEKAKPGELRTGAAAFAGHDIPDDIRDEIVELLKKNERVLWVGRPVPEAVFGRIRFLQNMAPYVMFGGLGVAAVGALLILLQIVLWCTGLLTFPIIGILGLIPFFLGLMAAGVGLGFKLVTGVSYKRAFTNQERRAVYVVTERQAIIHRGDWQLDGDQIQQYTPEQLTNMRRTDLSHAPGCGDIIFASTTTKDVKGRIRGKDFFGFLGTPQVRLVEAIMREVLIDRVPPEEAESLKPGAFEEENEEDDKPRVPRKRAEKERAREDDEEPPARKRRVEKEDGESPVNAERGRGRRDEED
jgi:hypothetical protein